MAKVKLGEVAREYKSTVKEAADLPNVGLEHLIPREIELTQWSEDSDNTFTKGFKKGQMLFGRRRAYLKKAAVAPFDGICSGDITVIEAIPEKILPELLPFVIQNDRLFDYAVEKSAGSLSPRVKWEHLKNYEYELPEIGQQKELVDLLWAMTRAKKAYQNLLRQTDELVKSQFIEMFGSIKEPKCRYVPLKSLTDVCSGGTPDRKNAEYWSDGNIPWVKTTELQNNTIYSTEEYITDKGLSESAAKIVPAETILIAMYGQGKTRGMTAFLGIEACTNQACACILPTEAVRMKFLWHYFICQYEDLRNLAKGSNQANLNAGMIKDYLVPLPGIEAQKQFEQLVEQSDKSKFELTQAIARIDDMIKALMQG